MRPSKPPVDVRQAEVWARERYGFEATANELPGEIDRNFLLASSDGERRVLKVAPAESDAIEIECQHAALLHLEQTEVGPLVPRVLADVEGDYASSVELNDGARGTLRMVTYLEGRPLGKLGAVDSRLRRQIGRTLGRLDRALATFDHRGARRKHLWDVRHLLELRPLLELVQPDLRPLVERGLTVFAERVQPRLTDLRTSVIHNDANDYNLLVDEDESGRPRLCGLIDFGDMVHTITVAEPAIACAYAMLDVEDPAEAAAELTGGYEEAQPLEDLERELLPDLIVARLCTSLLWSAQARRDSPENEYLTISERPVSDLLRRLKVDSSSGNPSPRRSADEIVAVRRRHLGPNLSLSYRRPLKIVRGRGQYLYDENGRQYLDLVNNVSHVGHCHPRVVEAGHRQMGRLNTNSRYLHDGLAEYVTRLTATLPDPLSICYLVCTGTEANDLALRLARAHSASREIVVLEHAYHGHSPSLIEISTYKCEGPGGEGLAAHAHKAPCPDPYRGMHRGPDSGARYAEEIRSVLRSIEHAGRRPGTFLAESLLGCGGQIVPPAGFLQVAYEASRAAGAVCIADEVQIGFGRIGSHMWAFEGQGVVPDIVTLGKPIGNGHPLAAVVTTPEIAASFDSGMEYFNTFGGNPVSCAIGLAVLDVIEEEGLRENALEMGGRLKDGLRELAGRHELIGDVRGVGLFLGVELVLDRDRRNPATRETEEIIEKMKDRGFLLSTDGPDHNVIKIKPPMVLNAADVDATLQALDDVLSSDG